MKNPVHSIFFVDITIVHIWHGYTINNSLKKCELVAKNQDATGKTLVHALFVLLVHRHVLAGDGGNILVRYHNCPPPSF